MEREAKGSSTTPSNLPANNRNTVDMVVGRVHILKIERSVGQTTSEKCRIFVKHYPSRCFAICGKMVFRSTNRIDQLALQCEHSEGRAWMNNSNENNGETENEKTAIQFDFADFVGLVVSPECKLGIEANLKLLAHHARILDTYLDSREPTKP
jgi:hypothetical protein